MRISDWSSDVCSSDLASFYSDMGVDVTVVEMLDRLVPVEDADVSAFLEKQLKKQGMTIFTSAGVEELKATANGVTAKIKTKDGKTQSAEFSHAIVAIGIVPNTENIGLEALGVKTTKGHIDTDAMCRTNVTGIWAIGDVTAPPWLAHKAMHETVISVEAIAGNHRSEEHTSELQSLMRTSYAVFCLKKKKTTQKNIDDNSHIS